MGDSLDGSQGKFELKRPFLLTAWCVTACLLSYAPHARAQVPKVISPVLRFELEPFPESVEGAAARRERGPVSPGQIYLRDTVTVPEGGMDVEGELLLHTPDTLELLIHVGRRRGGVVMMEFRMPYEASITNLPPAHYVLRRTVVFHTFTGDTRRVEVAPDSLVTVQ